MLDMAAAATSSCLTKLLFLCPSPSPSPSLNVNPSPQKLQKSRLMASTTMFAQARFGSLKGGGAGVLEKPFFDQSQFDPFTQVLEGGDIGRIKDRKSTGSGDGYRVLLVHDIRHSENLVANVLPQVVPSVTPDDARRLFHESKENGIAVVIVTVKEHAEFYAQMMVRGGLRSTIEPDSSIL